MPANLLALGAIALWSTLAALGVSLAALPPFLLTGVALIVGSAPAWPLWRQWRVPPGTLALGVAGLFGYHFLLFVALRLAPPIEANLVNYLWPLLIVVLAPAVLDTNTGSSADARFYDRLLMFIWATLYGVGAVYVFDAFWPRNKQ